MLIQCTFLLLGVKGCTLYLSCTASLLQYIYQEKLFLEPIKSGAHDLILADRLAGFLAGTAHGRHSIPQGDEVVGWLFSPFTSDCCHGVLTLAGP